MYTTVFILGNHPALSVAELYAILPHYAPDFSVVFATQQAFCVGTKDPLPTDELIKKLGGTVKIGILVGKKPKHGITSAWLASLITPFAHAATGKFPFGVSVYASKALKGKKLPWGIVPLDIKRALKDVGAKPAYIEGEHGILNAAQIVVNNLTDKGCELLVIEHNDTAHVARTCAVQEFIAFSDRDYGRPARDAKNGMLPPKLARIMINLANCPKEGILLDPFCGSGTVLLEASLLEYTQIHGSDISPRAIEDSKKNLEWALKKTLPTIEVRDIATLATHYKKDSIDAIVTEPFLGPPLKGSESPAQIQKNVQDLRALYLTTLEVFFHILKKTGTAVLVVPTFKLQNPRVQSGVEWVCPLTKDDFTRAGFSISSPLPPSIEKIYTAAQALSPLWFHRAHQFLARQIVVFRKT